MNAWIDPAAWDACMVPGVAPADGAVVFAGVDIGLVDDTSAVSLAWYLEDERIAVSTYVWAARRDAVAHEHVDDGVIDLTAIEQHLRELHDRYRLSVIYDRRYFERSAALLASQGLAVAELAQNSGAMADAYEGWHQAVLGGTVAHAADPVLTSHVVATQAQRNDRGWKVSKMKHHRKIDAHVAAVMAHHLLAQTNRRSVYDERGVIYV